MTGVFDELIAVQNVELAVKNSAASSNCVSFLHCSEILSYFSVYVCYYI